VKENADILDYDKIKNFILSKAAGGKSFLLRDNHVTKWEQIFAIHRTKRNTDTPIQNIETTLHINKKRKDSRGQKIFSRQSQKRISRWPRSIGKSAQSH